MASRQQEAAVVTAEQVFPIVTFTEKDLAVMEAEGARVRCAEDLAAADGGAADEYSNLVPVRAVPESRYDGSGSDPCAHDSEDGPVRAFASGRVSRLPRWIRFRRWIRKKMGLRVTEAAYSDYEDPETAFRLLYQQVGHP